MRRRPLVHVGPAAASASAAGRAGGTAPALAAFVLIAWLAPFASPAATSPAAQSTTPTSEQRPAPPAAPAVLKLGKRFVGEITDADGLVTTAGIEARSAGVPALGARFRLEPGAPGVYRVELRSHAFDAYLVLRTGDEIRAEDDDGLLATHALVVFDVPAAGADGSGAIPFEIEACALHGGRGAFEIVLHAGPPLEMDPRARIEAEIADLREAIAVREVALGPEDPQLAGPCNELALRLKWLGDLAGARPLYERALRLYERGMGPRSIGVSIVSNNLGGVLLALGDLDGALAAAQRSVDIAEERLGVDDPGVAPYLGLLAETLRVRGELDAARPVYERALALAEAGGPASPDVSQALGNLGLLELQRGDVAAAAALLQRSLEIAEQVAGRDDPYVTTPLANLGSVRLMLGQYEQARQDLERALAILERVVGPDSVQLVEVLNSLAMIDEARGDFARARAVKERVLVLAEAALGPDSPTVAMALSNLASTMTAQADCAAALPLAERALAIREARLAPGHPEIVVSVHNLASLAHEMGDLAAARAGYERALALAEPTLGPEHPLVAQTLNNLAAVLVAGGSPAVRAEARGHLERALAIREKRFGPEHPLVAETLGNLGGLAADEGDHDMARACHERGLAIEEAALGPEHPAVASHLTNLAGVLAESGDRAGAAVLNARALAIRERLLGPGHPLLVLSQLNLAELLLDGGDVGGALALLTRAEAGRAEHVARFLAGASEAEASAYTATIRAHIELGQSPVVRDARPLESAASLLTWKGQVLRAARQGRAALRDSLGERGSELADRLEQIGDALSHGATASARGEPPPSAAQIESLVAERQRLERELSAVAAAGLPAPPGWQQVRDALPERALLVDLFVHRQYEPVAATASPAPPSVPRGQWSAPVVTAWVTRRDREAPVAVALGSASAIEAALRATRGGLGDARGRPVTADAAGGRAAPGEAERPGPPLETLVLEPLRPHLDGVDLLIVSPDGALATLPFETLRLPDGSYLVESLGCVYLTDPTDLVRLRDDAGAGGSAARADDDDDDGDTTPPSLLAVGDVDFARAAAAQAGKARTTAGTAPPASAPPNAALRGALAESWAPLPATRAEVEGALAQHGRSFAGAERAALTGEQATEEALVELMPRYSVLHVATHGFFAPQRLRSLESAAQDEVERGRGEGERLTSAPRLEGWSSGLLSGLVCAGANTRLPADRDDGYLTAEEVGWVDLSRCRLVVLSACETGLGRPQSGEGLLGLRRAFLTAGARTVISSLWSVPDQETAELMGLFYENLWAAGLGTHAALRAAQLELIRRNRDRYGDARPVTWGAFVLDGDWR